MGPFEMVVAIIFIITVGNIIRTRAKYRASGLAPTEVTQMQKEIARLRDRVQVLERVITDNEGSLRLDREIERLRDRDRDPV
jgi:hypothetical protein